MNKKGFTLVELLAVIAIISILAVFVVPNVLKINTNVNTRLYEQKKEDIEYAAELYASNNPDIFNGTSVVYVTVQELLEANYLELDSKYGNDNCTNEKYKKTGCIINNSTGEVMNDKKVKLTKKTVGVVAELIDSASGNEQTTTSSTLVAKVCEGFNNDTFSGKTLDGEDCNCGDTTNNIFKKGTTTKVDECIIVSNKPSGEVDNWLKYGSEDANWRVLGLYRVDGNVSAKMITSDVIE